MTERETVTRALAGPLVNARATSAGVAPWAPTPGSSIGVCGRRRRASETARGCVAPTTVSVTTRPATTQATLPAQTRTQAPAAQFYRVRAGDTLETIADQYGTTVEELLTLNPDVDPVELSIGQRIRVQ